MAKSKSFFGLRRGSTKSLTFQVLDGQQITKDRVTEVKNPRSNGQLVQRAIMATVMQAYSQGKAIFDHAFQGKSVGAANQREFMSQNANILRSLVAAEINGGVNNMQARVVAPKSLYPVPFGGMMISRGSYDQRLFDITDSEDAATTLVFGLKASASAEETAAEWAERVGFFTDDLYTIVLFPIVSSTPVFSVSGVTNYGGQQYPAQFSFIRLRCKDLSQVTTPIDDLKYTDLFTAEASNIGTGILDKTAIGDVELTDLFSAGYDGLGAIGIIRSREDEDLRSTSYLHLAGNGNLFGITAPYLIDAWKQGTEKVGSSDLILEGGNF